MVLDDIRPLQEKPQDIVDDKFLKRLQQEWLPSHWSSVECFSLLVAQGPLDYPDAEIRSFWSELIFRIIQIPEEPVDRLLQFPTRNLLSVPDALSVVQDLFPVLTLHSAFSASTSALVFLSLVG